MNIPIIESAIVEQSDIRDKLIRRIEVLDKVKQLFLVPEMEVMTTKMLAEYFEVDDALIRKCYQRNKTEIDSDGVTLKTLANMRDSRY